MDGDMRLADIERLLREMKAQLDDVRDTLRSRSKPHYTVDEVAKLTGRAPFTVRRWIAEKRLNAIRISGTGPRGRLLIARAELDNLIAVGLGECVPPSTVD
jgi:excisionase family DNA binding protein